MIPPIAMRWMEAISKIPSMMRLPMGIGKVARTIGDRRMPVGEMNKKASQGNLPDSPGYVGGLVSEAVLAKPKTPGYQDQQNRPEGIFCDPAIYINKKSLQRWAGVEGWVHRRDLLSVDGCQQRLAWYRRALPSRFRFAAVGNGGYPPPPRWHSA
jgi:hypothetical protein